MGRERVDGFEGGHAGHEPPCHSKGCRIHVLPLSPMAHADGEGAQKALPVAAQAMCCRV